MDVGAVGKALSLQQQRSQEQAKFLGMLAHEFKTPLFIIKRVVRSVQLDLQSSNHSEQAICNIDTLIDRCIEAESLIHGCGI
jgi:signal transduction histidine kinase